MSVATLHLNVSIQRMHSFLNNTANDHNYLLMITHADDIAT